MNLPISLNFSPTPGPALLSPMALPYSLPHMPHKDQDATTLNMHIAYRTVRKILFWELS